MNGEELLIKLKETLEELDISETDFFQENYSSSDFDTIVAACGEWETVEYGRGATGDHDSYDIVYHFKNHNLYFEANGYYSSWDGTDWSDASLYQVIPKEKTITIYEVV